MNQLTNIYQPDKIGQFGFLETDEEYFAFPAVSTSRLKLILKSEAHFLANPEKQATKAMTLGTALHTYILEKERFKKEYAVFEKPVPDADMRNGENRKAKKEMESSGVKILTSDELRFLAAAGHAISENQFLSKLTDDSCIKERGIWWVHPSGITCKCKPDSLRMGKTSITIADVKKTIDASHKGFQKACKSFDYPLQDSFYSMITQNVYSDKHLNPFIFILCEDKPPYLVQHYTIESWQRGLIQEWIEKTLWMLAEKINENQPFEGYSNPEYANGGMITAEMPEYYIEKFS